MYLLLFGYVAGLLLYQADPFLFTVFLFLGILYGIRFRSGISRKGWWFCLFMFFYAGSVLECRNPVRDPKHYLRQEREGFFCARVGDLPRQRERTWRVEVELEGIWSDSRWKECRGKVYAYFPKSSDSPPAYGNRIYFRGKLLPVRNFAGRDGEYFDYASFLARRAIYAQCFLREGDWKAFPWKSSGPMDFLKKKMFGVRSSMERFLESSGMESREVEVGKALVLGSRIQDPIRDAYRDTGIVHVLAVSGMHLSIFALLAVSLFSFLGGKAWQRYLRFLAVFSWVFAYAVLTGMSASVSRAVCMFGFVAWGKCLGRKVGTAHSLAVSAFFLLIVNPFLIYDWGFLLSYAAVAGLVFLSPSFLSVFRTSNSFLGRIWKLAAASVAAQSATLPVILYGFGTFPTYFLLANLLVTPLVNLALPWGLVTVTFSCFWQEAAVFFAKGLEFLLWMMNELALGIGKLPFSLLRIPISLFSAVLSYGFLLVAVKGLRTHSAGAVKTALVLLVFLFGVG